MSEAHLPQTARVETAPAERVAREYFDVAPDATVDEVVLVDDRLHATINTGGCNGD